MGFLWEYYGVLILVLLNAIGDWSFAFQVFRTAATISFFWISFSFLLFNYSSLHILNTSPLNYYLSVSAQWQLLPVCKCAEFQQSKHFLAGGSPLMGLCCIGVLIWTALSYNRFTWSEWGQHTAGNTRHKIWSKEPLKSTYMSATVHVTLWPRLRLQWRGKKRGSEICSHKGFRLQCTVIVCRRGG